MPDDRIRDDPDERPRAKRPRPEDEDDERPRRRSRRDDEDDDRVRRRIRRNDDDDAGGMNSLIPYKNPKALIAYYCGVFSLIPLVGIVLGITSIILGILGLKYRKAHSKAGGTGSIVLSTAADWAGANSGPTLADAFNFTNSGNAGGPGMLNAGPTQIAAIATNYSVITAMGPNAHANNVAFTTSFTLANNPAWETGSYTINIVYTLSST